MEAKINEGATMNYKRDCFCKRCAEETLHWIEFVEGDPSVRICDQCLLESDLTDEEKADIVTELDTLINGDIY